MIKPFYSTGEFEVREFRNRRVLDEIEMGLTAFDCFVADDAGVYCSSDVTTGRRLYFEVYRRHGARSADELKDRLGAEEYERVMADLVRANVLRGVEFTESLRQRGVTNLINPGPFSAKGFEQQHYHYFWECVIIKKVYKIYFNEGWEYSNGCAFEYAVGHRKGIPLLDHLGRNLSLAEATALIERAAAALKAHGIPAAKLEHNLALIKELG